jgi:hypothetical protein
MMHHTPFVDVAASLGEARRFESWRRNAYVDAKCALLPSVLDGIFAKDLVCRYWKNLGLLPAFPKNVPAILYRK